MTTIEIARRMAELGNAKEACAAYGLVAGESGDPKELLEAAVYLLEHGDDRKVPFTLFVRLYGAGHFREDILPLMTRVFYAPDIRARYNRYLRNCKALEKYPYIFRGDFPKFEDLSISFFPYDAHNGYVPFDLRQGEFLEFVNPREPVVRQNFFADLEKPVLAKDVFSQYELEYLNDNVRPSEWVGRENHIYLWYENWKEFCSWLQVLNLRRLLESKKVVFLFGDEIAQYPIDFKERFGIDYGKYPVKPLSIREVNRLIWHGQLSAHNGGDFFNEIFDSHPNLIVMPSLMFDSIMREMEIARKGIERCDTLKKAQKVFAGLNNPQLVEDFYQLKNRTDKDYLVMAYLVENEWMQNIDMNSRVAPALFLQAHFAVPHYNLSVSPSGQTMIDAGELGSSEVAALFRNFKYIKTFLPMRRFTTSYAAMIRYQDRQVNESLEQPSEDGKKPVFEDSIGQRVLMRSYLRDPDDRLYKDSVIVRFEDGKLNPEATFRALAAFLDLPYTESMTYCSRQNEKDPLSDSSNARGFDTSTVYRRYEDFANDAERAYIEYCFRDAYEYYGYDFECYDGKPMDGERLKRLLSGFTTIDYYIRKSYEPVFRSAKLVNKGEDDISENNREQLVTRGLDAYMENFAKNRLRNAEILSRDLRFINQRGQPLQMIPWLKPDPAYMVAPLYH